MKYSSDLVSRLRPSAEAPREPKPQFFNLSRDDDQTRLSQLLDENPHLMVIDRYEQQLKELFILQYPSLYQDKVRLETEFAPYREAHDGGKEPWRAGLWTYLPWRDTLLHLLPDEEFQHVRTARNRNLIPPDEQEKYYHSTVGIAGLSVGNSVALALVLMGGAKRLRLADHDTLELTNLNRIRGSIADLTKPKVSMTAQQIYELDPYANLTLFTDGLTAENIERFFDGPPQLNVVIDEIDNLGMKLRIREEAKKRRIPVVMATDNGDSGLIDIERYDLDPSTKPFHGRLPEEIAARIRAGEKLPLPVVGQTIGEHLVGWEIVEPRMQASLLEIGKTIPTWPQLGGAALLNGVAVAVAVRKILTGQPVTDQRAILSLASVLIPNYDSPERVEARRKQTEAFITQFHGALRRVRGQ
ncbi:MAG: hypothetical protein G01um101438_697 [Parcubacteria group bacterium Gr01-1014_38]|nr:MAG: hypothetical protein G01um101438_697 [Parcubacteria group bacterium Gr01-1014_38]